MPLPADLYEALRLEAERARRPANALAREAIAQWIDVQRQAHIEPDIRSYAGKVAATPADLDPDLEAAVLEFLASEL